MTDLRKAAEQALNHLTNLQPYLGNGLLNKTQLAFVEPNIDEAMKKLRQALAMEKFSEVNQEIEEAIKKGTKAWADVPNATEWVDDLRGTDFSGALKPPLTCLETPGIVDLDKYYSVTYKSPLGASVYDVDGVKWLIENRGADYFTRDVKKVDISEERVHKTEKSIHEPVAWRNAETGEFCTGGFLRKDLAKWTPLYTAPPNKEWIGLTEDDRSEIRRSGSYSVRDKDFQAIEDKLREKNV